jgi:hypothetical protein
MRDCGHDCCKIRDNPYHHHPDPVESCGSCAKFMDDALSSLEDSLGASDADDVPRNRAAVGVSVGELLTGALRLTDSASP